MRDKVTSFDLNAAFRALDELEYPTYTKSGLRGQKLHEDLYNVNSQNDLTMAKEEREDEIAKAKLAKIEKIVDLDAKTPEDIQPSYVGKDIIQCPQCMTLFYKDPADVVKSEESDNVNVGEICQHCGNDSGYTLIGKVAEESVEEPVQEPLEEIPVETTENTTEESPASEENGENANAVETAPETTVNSEEIPEETEEAATEEQPENEVSEKDIAELEQASKATSEDEEKEEKKEESITANSTGMSLTEQINNAINESTESADKNLNKKLAEYNDYIKYLQQIIAQEENALKKAENSFVKSAIQRRLDAFRDDLNAALPEELKDAVAEEKLPDSEEASLDNINVDSEDPAFKDNSAEVEENKKEDSDVTNDSTVKESLTEDIKPQAKAKTDITDDEYDELMDDPEFNTPISDAEVKQYLKDEDLNRAKIEELDTSVNASEIGHTLEDLDDTTINKYITESLTKVYENVKSFEMTDCSLDKNNLMIEGLITFKSGKTKPTKYVFNSFKIQGNRLKFSGINESFNNSNFVLRGFIQPNQHKLFAKSLKYKYKIDNSIVEGLIRK